MNSVSLTTAPASVVCKIHKDISWYVSHFTQNIPQRATKQANDILSSNIVLYPMTCFCKICTAGK